MLFERAEPGRRAVILQIELRRTVNPDQLELAELARSAEIDVAHVVLARRDAPQPNTFVGKGKVEEVRTVLREYQADLLLVNHELNAGQQRNLEQALSCRVMTRTELILTIFADRAHSHEGQLQVELAQLKHAQTRLVRGWTHLDRQKGGIGLRGAGEKQIELDQRMLSMRIKAFEKKLTDVAKRRSQNRRGRNRRGVPTVALVGYTNAGKSTLFNRLTTADVYAEDQLFATLDPTTRKIPVPGLNDVVIADTVGFVSLLPHALIEAFKATLEEVAEADLLIHVVDASDALMNERIGQVRDVLIDIGAGNVPELVALNKIDLVDECPSLDPGGAQKSVNRHTHFDCAPVSALDGRGMEDLMAKIGDALGVASPHEVVLDSSDGKTRAWLYRSGAVLNEALMDDGRLQLTLQGDQQLIEELKNSPSVLLRRAGTLPRISMDY